MTTAPSQGDVAAENIAAAPATVPGLTSDRMAVWIEHWRRPTGGLAVKLWLGLLGLILLTGAVVYATGGTGFVWVHLMYVPIVLASGVFGIRGGVASAVVGGIIVGPFMPLDVAKHIPQDTANWLFRSLFFLLVGGCSGLLFSWVNRQMERLRATHLALVQTHEELKAAQMRLIQNAKLESVGRLAAGVAHEVKNPLAVIQLGVDHLTNTVKGDTGLAETVQDMEDAIQRADTVIKGLLDFSRSEQLTLAPADVNAVLEETLLLVKHELTRNHVTVERDFAEQLPHVRLDRNKLKQVFINLFMNAIQAMGSNGGTLGVRTRRQRLTAAAAEEGGGAPRGFRAGDDVIVVDVEDTGTGIPEDKLDKLFDPFFTTKAVGSGTGLGLSVSLKIIELHGAAIRIGNRQTQGAVARIIFKLDERNRQ
jgi:signal transduction histidine kinase